MKKILLTTLLVGLAALAVAGIAFAQTTTPPQPALDGTGGMRAGRFGGRGGGGQNAQGLLQPYMTAAMADALNIPVEELQAAHDSGESMWTLAEGYGLSAEDLQAAMIDARQQALEAAVADGVISADQADWMNARMNRGYPEGYGPGSQACDGSALQTGMGMRGGGRGRWSQP